MNFISVPFKADSGLSEYYGMGKFSSAGIVLEFESKFLGMIKSGVQENRVAVEEILDINFRKGIFRFGAKIVIRLKNFAKLAELPSHDGKLTLKVKRQDFGLAEQAVERIQKAMLEQQANLPPAQPPIASLFDESEAETKKLEE